MKQKISLTAELISYGYGKNPQKYEPLDYNNKDASVCILYPFFVDRGKMFF